MAQCIGSLYLWQASFRRHYASELTHLKRSKIPFHLCPFPSRSLCDESILPSPASETTSLEYSRMIVCFREDDLPVPEHPVQRDTGDSGVRTSLEVQYSPWAISMMNGFGKAYVNKTKESTGGPPGGNKGGDDGDGDGGGDDDEDDRIFLLPLLTLAFAAFHLGYCIAIWVKDESLDSESFRTGLGLFCLLGMAAIRLKSGAGLDAYVLGLGASLGVMFWTGERYVVKREGSLAGIVALLAASMAATFTASLYDNI
ncbi:hypothetical protein O6H91_16G013400 [Diphasiastrum complanatum]|uniref:Uncharacterized protein n=3 Tax=Diphasiastrum complanatum TaxID=34168 RepID=A0ACC2B9U9_DIPCM|nr:hypothetical protein O6H91_16G010700 [Diphasiastrum complanatum]KAJ7526534.1 hypothetical protein O6H91_16G010700 [Diphasiastrum complanatum]KAJ7526584.1 hypothetical protein O6H91_16G013400 [Diphasiastrum complanatum]